MTTTVLQTIVAANGAEVLVNENFAAVSPAGLYGIRPTFTSGLTFAYYGGRSFGNDVANGTLTLTDNATNYIVASRSTGAVSSATSTTNWNDSSNYMRLFAAIASGGTASYTDYREAYGSSAGGGGGGGVASVNGDSGPSVSLDAADIPITDTGGYFTGTNVEAALQELGAGGGGGGMANPMTAVGDIIIGSTSGAPARLAIGATGYVLTVVAGAPAWAASGGGGSLANWAEAIYTASPNNVRSVAQFLAAGAATNIDAALTPKGTGAITAQVADATGAGGDKRGTRAVDLQMGRASADQVASGAESVAMGVSCKASASPSYAIGDSSAATNSYAMAFGYLNAASGYASITIGGRNNTASGTDSATIGGQYLNTKGIIGMTAFGAAGSTRAATGRRQGELYALAANTTDNTATAMGTDGGTAGANNQIVLDDSSCIAITGTISARQGATDDMKAWTFSACAKRLSGAGTTTLVGTPTVTSVGADSGASAWAFAVVADTTNGAIALRVTGENSKTITWTAAVMAARVMA